MKFLILLYPRVWRKRYGREFDALLEDVRPGWRVVFDLLQGAIRVQLTTWSFWKIVAAFGAAGIVIAAVAGMIATKTYESRSALVYELSDVETALAGTSSQLISEHLAVAQNHLRQRGTLSTMIRSFGLYPTRLRTEPLENVIEDMNHDINIVTTTFGKGAGKRGVAFQVQYKYSDPATAQKVTAGLVDVLATSLAGSQVLDNASLPSQPLSPLWSRLLSLGLAAGVFSGIFVLKLTKIFRPN